MASSVTSDMHFNFLELPSELRIAIYEFAFSNTQAQMVPFGRLKRGYDPPGILLANKQLHLEATPVFYHNTAFQLTTDLADWLARLQPRYRQELKFVHFSWYLSYRMQPTAEIHMHRKGVAEDSGVELKEGVLWVPARQGSHAVWMNEFGRVELMGMALMR